MKFLLIFITLLSITLFMIFPAACHSGSFGKPWTVEQYLSSFNKIDNELNEVASKVSFSDFPYPINDSPELNNSLESLSFAYRRALQKTGSLKAPDIAGVEAHLAAYTQFLQDMISPLQDIELALALGDDEAYGQGLHRCAALSAESSSCRRLTETLMQQYDITDTQVDYRYRGE